MSAQAVKPGFKQTEVGVIPEDWVVKPLAKIATLQRGFDLPQSKLRQGAYPVVYSNGVMNFHAEAAVRGPGVTTGRSGTLGNIQYLEADYWPHNTTLWVKNFHNNNPLFVYYFFSEIGFERFASGTGVPTLNRNDAHAFLAAIPPSKAEQEAIAEALGDADGLIEALECLLAKKRSLKQGAMQDLLTGKRRLPGFEVKLGCKQTEVGVIPEDWDVVPFERIAYLERGKFTARPRNDPKYYGGDVPFIQTGDVRNSNGLIRSYTQTLNQDGLNVSKLFRRGTLFFTIAANIGDVGFADFDAACPDSIVAIKARDGVNHQWLAHDLGNRKSSFENLASNNAQLNLNLEKLRPYLLPLPTKAEQEAIAEALGAMDAGIATLEQKLAKARAVKQGMMQELLTGRTRLL